MWWCFLPVAAEIGDVDPLTIEVRLINEIVLWYFLYWGLDQVDLEGALVSSISSAFGRRRAFEVNLVVKLTCWVSLLRPDSVLLLVTI